MNIAPVHASKSAAQTAYHPINFTRRKRPQLPNPKEYDYLPLYTPPDKSIKLQKSYQAQITGAYFNKNGELKPRVKKMLDKKKFVFKFQKENKAEILTIKQAIEKCLTDETKEFNGICYHGTPIVENARNIIDNGFDTSRISRTEFGPGIYFSSSEGGARDYGSAVLTAKCAGRCAKIDKKYYSEILNGAVIGYTRKYAGLNSTGYPTGTLEYEMATRVINEYARNVLINDLGYDITLADAGNKRCVIVHNPKAISDIKLINAQPNFW